MKSKLVLNCYIFCQILRNSGGMQENNILYRFGLEVLGPQQPIKCLS